MNEVQTKLPEKIQGTNIYRVLEDVVAVASNLTKVPDLMTGGDRARRFGACMGINIIPELDKNMADGPVLVSSPPLAFFDADSLEELRDRLVYEIDNLIELAKKHASGSNDIE
ncbi:MAG: hypothetical protein D6732_08240 [Methanobacteriota archaeon]|nr:MAG: hypothetical protein D6732_08240 [Euryarchaeota archaeon]